MTELNKKYIDNTININELKALKEIVNQTSDNQLAQQMSNEWNSLQHEDIKCNNSMNKSLNNIKKRINFENKKRSTPIIPLYKRITQVAVAILFPLLLISTLYLYNETKVLETADMIVSTGKGEFANITLPDGTKVALNSESTLNYAPHLYNKKERSISFVGEAYFNVTKDNDCNFYITTKDVEVTVLGTKFNLLARDLSEIVSLSLEEGKVLFSSTLTNENTIVTPNQKAELLKSTGEIRIYNLNEENVSSWRKKELIFRNTTFKDVIYSIENNYDVTITLQSDVSTIKDVFSGIIPSNNLIEALQIIEESYNLSSSINEKQVIIYYSK